MQQDHSLSKSGGKPSPNNRSSSTLILDFSAPRTARNKCWSLAVYGNLLKQPEGTKTVMIMAGAPLSGKTYCTFSVFVCFIMWVWNQCLQPSCRCPSHHLLFPSYWFFQVWFTHSLFADWLLRVTVPSPDASALLLWLTPTAPRTCDRYFSYW